MRALLCLALLSTPAYAEIEHVDPEVAADTIALDRPGLGVLIWVDARLYLDPVDTAPSVQLALPITRKDAVGQVVPARVLGSDKSFVQIEPTKDVDCTWSKLASHKDLAKLKLWVKRTDLAPVLAKPFRQAWKDGTRITLATGTPLGRSKKGYVVSIHGEQIEVAVPATSVTYAYKPGKVVGVKKRAKKVWLDKKPVTIGDQALQLSLLWTAPNVQARGNRVLFTLEARCMTAVVSVARTDVDRDLHGFAAMVGPTGGEMGSKLGAERWLLPKGTALTSATGTASVAVTSITIEVPNPGKTARVCIERPIEIAQPVADAPGIDDSKPADRTLKLCAPASAIQHDRGLGPIP
jgi:hypothetical protein